ncbi:sugar ABC transporter substrate-binding protein (plasmid) [Paraburkholderia sp. D15]|uniref:multiple monosaccharide ABC transporter substrate-binding protein n=1 Tax=Paraburkholderia sp. D15 TaxID=2880218 RepID=UPI002479A3CC|nr:multiple monosaccharide ABC transporter substrate-binding protein [Paraburkholderia sp. D15]WGS54939.1 sugar ABC transporter substrate-binding protein [Paraburkholderia sp. D15]
MKSLKLVAAALALSFCAAAPYAHADDNGMVGISMPTKSSSRWISDGQSMVDAFKAKGYQPDLQYAEDEVPNQIAQIENMITKGVKILVIAPIDGTTLSNTLSKAQARGIKVIAYDRLIRGTRDVDYYATFDNFGVGAMMADSVVKSLDLNNRKTPANIEIFAGSADDNNAHVVYDGMLSVMKPYMDSGKAVVRSKQVAFDKVATFRWDGATAQARMDNLLSAYYGNSHVDAVLSPYDGISIGIISALKGVGYGTAQQPMPVITGQDAEIPSIKAIIRGDQKTTVFKDTRELAKAAVDMADAALNNKPVPVNDTKTYNNGVKVVPTSLLKPVLVDSGNWKTVLVSNGYYKESQLK